LGQLAVLLELIVWPTGPGEKTTIQHHYAQLNRELADARRNGDRRAEACTLIRLGDAHWVTVDDVAEAARAYEEALVLSHVLRDPWLEAAAIDSLGRSPLLWQEGRASGWGSGNSTLNGRWEIRYSAAHLHLDQYELAVTHAERALSHYRHAGNREGQASALHHIAMAQQGMGQHSDAITLCEQALSIGHLHSYPPEIASTLKTLAASLERIGHTTRASACKAEALAIEPNHVCHTYSTPHRADC
jgi:tetratricopeptide (TPR) repeat protein